MYEVMCVEVFEFVVVDVVCQCWNMVDVWFGDYCGYCCVDVVCVEFVFQVCFLQCGQVVVWVECGVECGDCVLVGYDCGGFVEMIVVGVGECMIDVGVDVDFDVVVVCQCSCDVLLCVGWVEVVQFCDLQYQLFVQVCGFVQCVFDVYVVVVDCCGYVWQLVCGEICEFVVEVVVEYVGFICVFWLVVEYGQCGVDVFDVFVFVVFVVKGYCVFEIGCCIIEFDVWGLVLEQVWYEYCIVFFGVIVGYVVYCCVCVEDFVIEYDVWFGVVGWCVQVCVECVVVW